MNSRTVPVVREPRGGSQPNLKEPPPGARFDHRPLPRNPIKYQLIKWSSFIPRGMHTMAGSGGREYLQLKPGSEPSGPRQSNLFNSTASNRLFARYRPVPPPPRLRTRRRPPAGHLVPPSPLLSHSQPPAESSQARWPSVAVSARPTTTVSS